jgi:hypothetical protein
MEGWEQIVRVQKVDPFDITDTSVAPGDPYILKVEVEVIYDGPMGMQPLSTTVSWIMPG